MKKKRLISGDVFHVDQRETKTNKLEEIKIKKMKLLRGKIKKSNNILIKYTNKN